MEDTTLHCHPLSMALMIHASIPIPRATQHPTRLITAPLALSRPSVGVAGLGLTNNNTHPNSKLIPTQLGLVFFTRLK